MTFLELIVVLGIFGAIAATVLFNYSDFSTNVHLQNLAQDVALQIKRAQTDAVSGRAPALSVNQQGNIINLAPPNWVPSYGMAFTTTQNTEWSGAGTSFIYYFNSQSDSFDDNGETVTLKDFYDFEVGSYQQPCGSSGDSECLEEINITSGDFVDIICFNFTDISPGDDCTGDGEQSDHAYISFTRPRSNASIMLFDDPNASDDMEDNVYIRLTSREGGHKYISVWQSGYISIR